MGESREVTIQPSTAVLHVGDPRTFYLRETGHGIRGAPEPLALIRCASLPQRRPTPRHLRPPPRRRSSRSAASRAGPDEPSEPAPQTCEVCGDSLEGKYRNAKTCGERCRVAKHRKEHRKSKISQPSPELLHRYDAAITLVDALPLPDRIDLLAAVVWPRDARLREAA
jgi:hypothetical protein